MKPKGYKRTRCLLSELYLITQNLQPFSKLIHTIKISNIHYLKFFMILEIIFFTEILASFFFISMIACSVSFSENNIVLLYCFKCNRNLLFQLSFTSFEKNTNFSLLFTRDSDNVKSLLNKRKSFSASIRPFVTALSYIFTSTV